MNATTMAIVAGVAICVTFALVFAARRKMVGFEIRIRDGKVFLHSGLPPAAFLSDVQEVVARTDVRRATILGMRKGRRVELLFSGSISRETQQQVRNVWSLLR